MVVARLSLVRITLVGAGYLAVVVALTWPLAALMTTHLPRTFRPVGADMHLTGWALAWQTHALVTDPAHVLDANVYWPHRLALLYGTPGFGLLPAFAPVFLASGNPTLALNAALLSCLALTATTLHLVVTRWTASSAAGAAAATTFLCSQTALQQVGLMPQYAALAALPLVVWMVAEDALRWPGVVCLAGLIALQGLTDAVYVAPPLFLTLGIAAVVLLCRPATAFRGWRLLLALGLAACALAPLYAGYLEVRTFNPDLRRQSVWLGQVTREMNMAFWHPGWLPARGPLALDVVVVLLVLAGFVVSVAGTRTHWHAWFAAGLFFASGLAVSWVLPSLAPGFRSFVGEHFARDLLRLGFGGLIGACLLAGLAFAACADALASRAPAVLARVVPVTLLLAFLAALVARAPVYPAAYPVAPAPIAGSEARVLRAGSGPVLELPMGKDGLGREEHANAMYRSIAHWRPLLNGYMSYYPRTFARHMALALALPDRQALETLREETGVRTIVVDLPHRKSPVRRRWDEALAGGLLPGARLVHRDAAVLVVELDPRAGDRVTHLSDR